jgi:hypothetical protein
MADAPYQKTFRDQDGMYFHAEIPALAHIGARFDELLDASIDELVAGDEPPTTVMLRDLEGQVPQNQKIADKLEQMKQQAAATLQQMIDSKRGSKDQASQVGLDALSVMLGKLTSLGELTPPPDDLTGAHPKEQKADNDEASHTGGPLKFKCGYGQKISQAQIDLFNQFVDGQQTLRSEIEAALRELHDRPGFPREEVQNSRFSNEADAALQCFRICDIELDSAQKRIVINLESTIGHFDEHGCAILVSDGKVTRYGQMEEVFGEDDFDYDEDEEEDDE